jgi:uncharacterized SAM-binding protein YcdF (DUF218 family)
VARAGWILAGAAGVILLLFGAGFLVFASAIARYTPATNARADGIVVLTGGEHRLSEAVRLLAEGRGKRLLISGANPIASRADLLRKSGLSTGIFKCCVDIGYAAHDTKSNADETKAWADNWGFVKLLIVTSTYHMPRSLTELGSVMPDVVLVPYPVISRNFRNERWWLHPGTARLLLSEYLKFLPSAVRYAIGRLTRWESSAVAKGARADGDRI